MTRQTIDQFISKVKADHVSEKLTAYEIQGLRDWQGFLPGEQDEILIRLRILRRARTRRPQRRRSTKVIRYKYEPR
jgi:hypothetical protein